MTDPIETRPPLPEPFLDASDWSEDSARRMNPALLTRLMHESVPALAHVDWKITKSERGALTSVLPLTRESTNQHGTHQALLMGMAADYTGGLALAGIIPDVPIGGIHPVQGREWMVLWLAKAEMRYARPSTADLIVSAQVPRDRWQKIRKRYAEGRTQLINLEVHFHDPRGQSVATGAYTYYMRASAHVRPQSSQTAASTMHEHLLKSSARMIANVRGRGSSRVVSRFADPYSQAVAGRHGELLGNRSLELLPELSALVASRTRHVDELLTTAYRGGCRQFVLVPSGLDMRPRKLASEMPDARWCCLDLPEMLDERQKVQAELDGEPGREVRLPTNLEFEDPQAVMSAAPDFDLEAPTIVIFEGGSMYFEREALESIVGRLRGLLRHPHSRLWLDLVSQDIVHGQTEIEPVDAFVANMAKLGEPFLFGSNAPGEFLRSNGLELHDLVTSRDSIGADDLGPVFDHYWFATCSDAGVKVIHTGPSGRSSICG